MVRAAHRRRMARLLDQSDYGAAIIEAEDFLDFQPFDAEGMWLLAEALCEAGEFETAVELLEEYIDRHGAADPCLRALAVARFETCDFDGAVNAADAAIALPEGGAEPHFFRALALERLGRHPEAKNSFIRANEIDPIDFPCPLRLSDGEWEDAIGAAFYRVRPSVRAFWRGVPIELEPFPEPEELRAVEPPITPSISGMYAGRRPDPPDPLSRPPALRLFTGNLARCGDRDAVVSQIARTLEQEALDWLCIAD